MPFTSYFVTTAIPYVNSKPHVGTAQEFVLADFLARAYRQKGLPVILQSGTDDNATKNVLAAKQAGVSTKEFVDLNSARFAELLTSLNVFPDLFVRTSQPKHFREVQDFIGSLSEADVYASKYSGLYCSGCEDFFSETDLVNGLCPDHQRAPESLEEENIFFTLSRYQDELYRLIESDTIKITPAWKKNEILSFIGGGLKDISLSRSSVRCEHWGVPYPGVAEQTVYVWIDALINYLSGDSGLWREDVYKVHVIGKNVWKFHAIYWPALLLSAGLPLPNEIVIHGFLTNEGIKISKSLGNGADPFQVVEKYGVDALRFYLLWVLSFDDDADFVEKNLVAAYNSELANKLGNVTSRVLTLCKGLEIGEVDESAPGGIEARDLRDESFRRVAALNAAINTVKPWELQAAGESEKLIQQLRPWVRQLFAIATLVEPLIPAGSARLRSALRNRGQPPAPLYPRRQIE